MQNELLVSLKAIREGVQGLGELHDGATGLCEQHVVFDRRKMWPGHEFWFGCTGVIVGGVVCIEAVELTH